MVPDLDDLEEMDDGLGANQGSINGLGSNAEGAGLGGFGSEIPTLDVPASRRRYAQGPANGSGGYQPGF